jgi:type IV secretory pathway component VirB8
MDGIPRKGYWSYDHHDDERRHRPVHACSIFIFRTLTAVATAASIILLLKSGETTYYHGLKVSQGWRSFDSFK